MNKSKLFLFLILQTAVFSASALSLSNISGNIPFELNDIGDTDQISILANSGEDIADVVTPTDPGEIRFFQNIAPSAQILITSTMNRRSAFEPGPFSLQLFDASNPLVNILDLTIADYAVAGPFGLYTTVLNLPIDTYRFRFAGPVDENSTSINLRVEAIPIPAAVWLFGSALVGLVTITRRKKAVTI